jgi:hypothetical protein
MLSAGIPKNRGLIPGERQQLFYLYLFAARLWAQTASNSTGTGARSRGKPANHLPPISANS